MFRRKFAIKHLGSGGLITNYYCTSRCGHCLYACSSRWEKRYIGDATVKNNILKIKALGCHSIHIGGGEPFLDMEGLRRVVEGVHALGVHVEYVETNASWYKDFDSARRLLETLRDIGLSTLLVSISPFHNEYIPFFKVKGVVEACKDVGIRVFPWISEFVPDIESFDDMGVHTMSEYESRYGMDYLKSLPSRYWIHYGGRALKTFAHVLRARSHEAILAADRKGCRELLDVSHFHFDLFGNYIPGLCSGLAIRCDDMGDAISSETYPFLHLLFERGVSGLFDVATKEHAFIPADGYISKCHLCFDIRRHLVLHRNISSPDLQPKGFYENV